MYVFLFCPCIAYPCSPAEGRVQVLAQQWNKKSIAMTSPTAKIHIIHNIHRVSLLTCPPINSISDLFILISVEVSWSLCRLGSRHQAAVAGEEFANDQRLIILETMVIVNSVLVGYMLMMLLSIMTRKDVKKQWSDEDGTFIVRTIVIVNYVFVHYVDGDEFKRINKLL